MNKKPRFLRITDGQNEGLYQIAEYTDAIDTTRLPKCPCCSAEMAPGFDVCQWGMFEDNYVSYCLCKPCGKAWELKYTVPTYSLFSKREQKALGFLPSKKSREAGSGAKDGGSK